MLQESSLEAINENLGVCILEMSLLLESIYRHFLLLQSWGGGEVEINSNSSRLPGGGWS